MVVLGFLAALPPLSLLLIGVLCDLRWRLEVETGRSVVRPRRIGPFRGASFFDIVFVGIGLIWILALAVVGWFDRGGMGPVFEGWFGWNVFFFLLAKGMTGTIRQLAALCIQPSARKATAVWHGILGRGMMLGAAVSTISVAIILAPTAMVKLLAVALFGTSPIVCIIWIVWALVLGQRLTRAGISPAAYRDPTTKRPYRSSYSNDDKGSAYTERTKRKKSRLEQLPLRYQVPLAIGTTILVFAGGFLSLMLPVLMAAEVPGWLGTSQYIRWLWGSNIQGRHMGGMILLGVPPLAAYINILVRCLGEAKAWLAPSTKAGMWILGTAISAPIIGITLLIPTFQDLAQAPSYWQGTVTATTADWQPNHFLGRIALNNATFENVEPSLFYQAHAGECLIITYGAHSRIVTGISSCPGTQTHL
jgi:hypothetical protein